MTVRRFAGAVVAALLGAATVAALPSAAEARSGYCPKGTGATVVVDRGALGGTSIGCDPNGAGTAASTVVPRAGFPLTYVERQPGFVCRVSGVPASDPCMNTPPADAYWGLFWSDGKSGGWTYSSVGVGSLKVPAGGFIGWRWQSSESRTSPGTAPSAPAPAPKPTPRPTRTAAPAPTPSAATSARPTAAASSVGTGTGASSRSPAEASAKAEQREKKQRERAKHKKAKASASASAGATAADASSEPSPSATTADPDLTSGERAGDGSGPALPLVAAGLVLALATAGGRLLWLRRRGAGPVP